MPKLAIAVGALASSVPHLLRSERSVDRQVSAAFGALLVSFVVSILATGPSPTILWGSEARADGLICAVVGLLVFAAASRSGSWLLPWWIGGLTVAAVYALVQKLGLDPVPWGIDHVPALTYRPFATLGSPSFLAIGLAMGLPALLLWSGRWWAVMLGMVFAVALLLTMSRAGIAAGVVGLSLAGLGTGQRPRAAFVGAVVLGLVLGAVWSGVGAPTSTARRFEADGGSARVRVELAASGLRALASSPAVGIGPGATAEWLASDRRANLTDHQRRNPSFHNWLLDAGAQRGILGLFATLWLVLAAGAVARGPLAGTLAAFLIGVSFGFPTTATWLAACMLLGVVSSRPGAGSTPRSPTC
ncbi:MAG: O-antigen ligase family protein [Nitrospirae bacterium]|nr:O-antigen ligase family protein [Fimbriimonadaceae bacterium]